MPTITQVATGLTEGDNVILFNITLNKPIDRSLTFSINFTRGSSNDHDYIITNATIPPYEVKGTMQIIVLDDGLTEG